MLKDLPTLGIIGGGQLGSMLSEAARKLKINVVVLSDDKNAPAQKFCNQFIYSKYNDQKNINKFMDLIDIVTFEFENIPYEMIKNIEKSKPVIPKPAINQIVQNRNREKIFINNLGIKTTQWALVKSKEDIKKNENLLPGILKTCMFGYDGKGQFAINSLKDVKDDWCFSDDYILEKKVKLKKEISIIITRFNNGESITYEPIQNEHEHQILKKSKIPANVNLELFKMSQKNAKLIADKLNYVGTMCVEYFIDQEENLFVNEIAPRVHNSGHLTINAFNISQFENHIRAVCDLKKLSLSKVSNAEMVNIIGDEIKDYRERSFQKGTFFYDYLKKDIRDKRKMGHLTILKK
jgi:5-(carboxyamino)imidazole ribonucleotide synthase